MVRKPQKEAYVQDPNVVELIFNPQNYSQPEDLRKFYENLFRKYTAMIDKQLVKITKQILAILQTERKLHACGTQKRYQPVIELGQFRILKGFLKNDKSIGVQVIKVDDKNPEDLEDERFLNYIIVHFYKRDLKESKLQEKSFQQQQQNTLLQESQPIIQHQLDNSEKDVKKEIEKLKEKIEEQSSQNNDKLIILQGDNSSSKCENKDQMISQLNQRIISLQQKLNQSEIERKSLEIQMLLYQSEMLNKLQEEYYESPTLQPITSINQNNLTLNNNVFKRK